MLPEGKNISIMSGHTPAGLLKLNGEIIGCNKCKRLVKWRNEIARKKIARYKNWQYWGKGVPGSGDCNARLLIVGLAPAAHGGNRTGRMFTGDRSGDLLFRAMYKYGFANQPISVSKNDGLKLHDCYITAAARCAPPGNKLNAKELENCQNFLLTELRLLSRIKLIIVLGRVAFDAIVKCLKILGIESLNKKPEFVHGKYFQMNNGWILLASYHPSQQNTFTGKLTEKMFYDVFRMAKDFIKRQNKFRNNHNRG